MARSKKRRRKGDPQIGRVARERAERVMQRNKGRVEAGETFRSQRPPEKFRA